MTGEGVPMFPTQYCGTCGGVMAGVGDGYPCRCVQVPEHAVPSSGAKHYYQQKLSASATPRTDEAMRLYYNRDADGLRAYVQRITGEK